VRDFAEPRVLALSLSEWGRALSNARREYAAAKALFDESLIIAKPLDLPDLIGAIYANLGHWAMQKSDYEAAKRYHHESLIWRRKDGTRWGPAAALFNFAEAIYLQEDYEQAQVLYQEAIELFRAIGMQFFVARGMMRLGRVALRKDLPALAIEKLGECHADCRKRADQHGIALCLAAYAELQRSQGRIDRAVTLLASEFVSSAIRGAAYLIERIEAGRTLAAARAQLDEATFNAAWEAGRNLTLEQAIALAQESDA
jgi:tetratricopeptide (TPR) repeat protein